MKIHTGEKLYKCSECSKSFRHANGCKIHMRIHTGEKPYRCSECTKSFSHSHVLKIHMKIHTGEKPYTCSECSKSFRRLNCLKIHRRVHTGNRSFPCPHCAESFRLSVQLKNHKCKLYVDNSTPPNPSQSHSPGTKEFCHVTEKTLSNIGMWILSLTKKRQWMVVSYLHSFIQIQLKICTWICSLPGCWLMHL